jgi:hypothetical protein
LLPSPDRNFPGGGGSFGRYPSALVERAIEGLQLARRHHHELHLAVATMFVRGRYEIDEAKLKRALLKILNRTHDELLRAAGSDVDPEGDYLEVSITAGVTLAKRAVRDPSLSEHRRRIPRKPKRPKQAVLETAMTGLAHLQLTGQLHDPEASFEILRMAGGVEILGESAAREVAKDSDLEDFSVFQLAEMASATVDGSARQLNRARATAAVVRDGYSEIAHGVQKLGPNANKPLVAFPSDEMNTLFLTFVNLIHLVRDESKFDRSLQDMSIMRLAMQGRLAFTEYLPKDLRALAALDDKVKIQDLSSLDRERWQQALAEFSRLHPGFTHVLEVQFGN